MTRRYPPPLPGRPAYAQPLSPWQQVPASMAFATDSNHRQPLLQSPPTACLTAAGPASEVTSLLLHPCLRGLGSLEGVRPRAVPRAFVA